MLGVGVSFILFWGVRQFARDAPGTMTAQYQEQTNEYLKVSDWTSDKEAPEAAEAFL